MTQGNGPDRLYGGNTPMSEIRMWAFDHYLGKDARRKRLTVAFAQAMHDLTCGDWGAAGYDTKMSFLLAADSAVHRLEQDGHDLLDVPKARAR